MADQQPNDTGSKDRATVALVYRTVDDLGKTVAAEFRGLNARFDALETLPAAVAAQHEMIVILQARMLAVENSDAVQQTAAARRRGYVLATLPALVISLIAAGSSFLALVLHA